VIHINKNSLSTDQFYLKELSEKHINNNYLSWLHDKEVTGFLEMRDENYSLGDLRNYYESFINNDTKYLFGVFTKNDHTHIGNTSIIDIDKKNNTCGWGYLIGDKNYWGTNAGRDTIYLTLKFCFDTLNIRKIFGGAYSNHIRAQFNLLKCGFEEEGILKEKYYHEDKLVDEIIYSMTKDKWEKIKIKLNIN